MKLLSLLSGGIGSLVATKIMLDKYDVEELYCLFVNYGQKAFALEKQCAKGHADLLGARQFISINTAPLRGGTAVLDSGYTDEDCHECVPCLYEHLLTIAANYMLSWGCNAVCAGQRHPEPEAFMPTPCGIHLYQPLYALSAQRIIEIGVKRGVAPLIDTWSCIAPQLTGVLDKRESTTLVYYPCGECSKCEIRAEAFSALDLEDPLTRLEITGDD